MAKDRVVGIIPARGNSKGIPRKNLKLLGDKPLLAWTIEVALSAMCVDSVWVTSEDREILHLAEEYKALTITRPPELSLDQVQLDDVYLNALWQMEYHHKVIPEVVILLQPTSPFRTAEDIDNAHRMFSGENTVLSVCLDGKFHWGITEENDVVPVWHNPLRRLGRQWIPDIDKLYQENGAVGVVDAKRFTLMERTTRFGPYTLYVMPPERSIDLDTMQDWEEAERMLEWNTIHDPA